MPKLSHIKLLLFLTISIIVSGCYESLPPPITAQELSTEPMPTPLGTDKAPIRDPNSVNFIPPESQENDAEKLEITNWNVDQSTWGYKSDNNDIFKSDIVLFYNTIFPNKETINKMLPAISPSDIADEESRQDFLKRLFIFLAYAPLKVTGKKNDIEELKEWSFPLAVALAHGGRIILESSDVPLNKSLYNLLLSGDWETVSDKDIIRLAASHGLNTVNGRFFEVKLGLFQSLRNLKLGLKKAHRGYNIAFGGLGNVDANGLTIGPRGTRYKNYVEEKNIQHGHFYMQSARSEEPNYDVLLLGIETSEPGKTNANGNIHNMLSAFKNSSLSTSLSGGKKMPFVIPPDQGGPAERNGLRATMTYSNANEAMKIYKKISRLAIEEQQGIFKKLLSGSSAQGQKLLAAFLSI